MVLDKREQSLIRDIAAELETIRLHESSDLRPVLRRVRELTELDDVCVYSMRNRTGTWRVERWEALALMHDAKPRFREAVEAASTFPLYYNPLIPPANQRNRVIDALAWIEKHSPGTWERSPINNYVLRPFNMHRYSQPRALLCDGRRLLGWFGGMHPTAPTRRQVRILSALVEPMRRRLIADETLREACYLRSALEVALSRLGAPACVVTARGAIRDANASARALLAESSTAVLGSLRDAVAGRIPAMPIDLVPVNDGEALWLAIIKPPSADTRIAACIASCNTRWTLTKKQQRVLALVMQGLSNAAIASELQCVERTVEMHMTALFDRVGVDNRAALVAKVLTTLS